MRSNRSNHSKTAIPPSPPSTSSPESSSDYAFSLTKIAVSQICNSIGFTTAESPALRTLTDIAARYLKSIAKSAADSANSGGRTESNVVDAVAAVDELSFVTGFPGAWRAAGSLLSSGAVKELFNFSNYSEEIPFAKPLPRKIFSTGKGGKCLRNVVGGGDDEYIGGKWKHIPKWLPVMPVIKEEEEERGGKGMGAMWGFCGEKIEGEMTGEEDGMESKRREKKGIKILPLKRGKVRFKIGNNNGVLGVCKRGGIGKRVLCENWVANEESRNQTKKRSLR